MPRAAKLGSAKRSHHPRAAASSFGTVVEALMHEPLGGDATVRSVIAADPVPG